MFEILLYYTNTYRSSQNEKEIIHLLQNILVTIRNLYLSGKFYTKLQKLMEMYDQLKRVVCDRCLDAIYINNLRTYNEEKLRNNINELIILNSKKKSEYCRMYEILNCLEIFYKEETDLANQQIFEEIFTMTMIPFYNDHETTLEYKLKMLHIIHMLTLDTKDDSRFSGLIDMLTICITKIQSSPTRQLIKGIEEGEQILSNKAHMILLDLFKENYLKYPPIRLAYVTTQIIKTLESKQSNILLSTLKFLSSLIYDRDFYLSVSSWDISSYYSYGSTYDNISISNSFFVNTVIKFINLSLSSNCNLSLEFLIGGLNVLQTIFSSHCGLYDLDLPMIIKELITFIEQSIYRRKLLHLIKATEALQLIFVQRSSSKRIMFSLSDALTILDIYFKLLRIIFEFFKSKIEELKKSRGWKEFQASTKELHKSSPFIKVQLKVLIEIVNFILHAISTSFYIYKEEMVEELKKLVPILREYINDIILIGIFAKNIQELIENIYFSNLIRLLPNTLWLEILELIVQIGWKNIFSLNNYSIPPISEFLIKGNYRQVPEHPKVSEGFSLLIYPSFQSTNQILESYDNKLKSQKVKIKEVNWDYFIHQKDGNIAMHMAIENIIQFFESVPTETQSAVLPYLSQIMALELKNDQSKLAVVTTMLNELLAWISYTNIERSIPIGKMNISEGHLWIINDQLVQIVTTKHKAKVIIRSITSNSRINLRIQTLLKNRNKDVQQNYNELKQLNETKVEHNIDKDILITPKHIMSILPGSLQSRFNESLGVWKPVNLTPDIIQLIKALDEIPVYSLHTIAILYIPKNCTLTEEDVFSGKKGSDRFTQFLSQFGSLISVKGSLSNCHTGELPKSGEEGVYGLLWRNELTQVFSYVNTLLAYKNINGVIEATGKEDYKRIKKYMEDVTVLIVWNEKGEKIPKVLVESRKANVFINIVVLPVEFCKVKIVNRAKPEVDNRAKPEVDKKKRYGPIYTQTLMHDSYLPKMILRSAIVADIKARRSEKFKEDGIYISELMRRCTIIKDIKAKHYS